MMHAHFKVVAFVIALTSCIGLYGQDVSHTKKTAVPSWLLGYWRLTADEDNLGISDLMVFTADGQWTNYTPNCTTTSGKFVLLGQDVFVIAERKKGPTAIIFRPNPNHLSLTFTSPRTGNNSAYSRVPTLGNCAENPSK